ncbi:hypothetical protein LI291_10600 [Intestinibacillus massiliensis]|nr:hypothetical protein [Intestinibacillus massiliensis]
MGCDIHVHIEVQNEAGKWLHHSAPDVKRDYGLFALMAGVRNYGKVQPIAEPRGLPDDISEVTSAEWEPYADNWHTPSYLMADELPELQQRYQELRHDLHSLDTDLEYGVFHTYVAGNSLSSHEGWKDLRIVFWFDN